MPFLAKEHYPIPTKDIVSWIHDGPNYDRERAIYIDATDTLPSISANQATILIRQLAAGFSKAGLKKGDTVLIHSFNNIYYPIIVLGIIAFGGVYTGTNPGYTAHELKHAIRTAKAKMAICEPELLNTGIVAAANECGIPTSKILALNTTDAQPIPQGHVTWRTLLTHGEQDWVRFNDEQTSKTTIAMLLFSSGTTGLPKAAMLTHYNFVAQHTLVFEKRKNIWQSRRLVALPMFHVAVAASTHTSPLRSGDQQIIMPRFDLKAFLKTCAKFQITEFIIVPPMVVGIIFAPIPPEVKKSSFKTLRHIMAAAAPLDAATQNQLKDFLPPGATFTQILGMTESCGATSMFHWPEDDSTGSVGRFLPNVDVKLLDDQGRDITDYDVPGEVAVRGPMIIPGYLGVPRDRDYDSEGYFRTGDVMVCKKDTGLWYVVDRKKELIKVRGFQVAPAELEGVLLEHPAIVDAAVIGVKSGDASGEVPRAYVVKKPGTSVTDLEVKKWIEDRLVKYKRLDGGVRFVDAIPKSASGKILKRVLRDQAKLEETKVKL